MAIFILHTDNLTACKEALRALLPNVRSSHLTEAIAAGLGFQTNASLVAKLKGEGAALPDIARVDDGSFAARLVEFGYANPPAIALTALVRSAVIPDKPSVEFRDRDRAANDAHFYECQHLGRPMVMVRAARLYATLEWDCITVDANREGYLFEMDNGGSFGRRLFSQYQARAAGRAPKSHYLGGSFTGWIKKLPIDIARDLADDYFCMLYLPLRQCQGPRLRAA